MMEQSRPQRTSIRILRKSIRVLGVVFPYVRVAAVYTLAIGLGLWGLSKIPHDLPTTSSTAQGPPVIEAASNVDSTVVNLDAVDLSPAFLQLSGTVINNAATSAKVYIVILGLVFSSASEAVSDNPGWEISDYPGAGGSLSGRTLAVPAGESMRFSFQLSIADCSCVVASGPYVTVYPVGVITGGKAQTGPDQFGETVTLTPVAFRGGPGEPAAVKYSAVVTQPASSMVSEEPDGAADPSASAYQMVSSSQTAPRQVYPGAWQWTGSTPGPITFEDLNAKSRDDNTLFLAGVLLGLAGAALVALFPETASFAETIRARREAKRKERERQAAASAAQLAVRREPDPPRPGPSAPAASSHGYASAALPVLGGVAGAALAWRLLARQARASEHRRR